MDPHQDQIDPNQVQMAPDQDQEQLLYAMIRSNAPPCPLPDFAEDDDQAQDVVASYLNESGEGMAASSDVEGEINEDVEGEERIVGPLMTTSGEVHILTPLVTRRIIYIHINESLFFFSPPDRAILNERRSEARPKSWAVIKGTTSSQSMQMEYRLSPGNS